MTKKIFCEKLTGDEFASPQVQIQEQEKALATRQEADLHTWAYFERVPGLFFTLCQESASRISMPFIAGPITSFLGITPEAVADDIAPLLALCHPDDAALFLAELQRSGRDMTPCCAEFRIGDPGIGQTVMELKALPRRDENRPGVVEWSGFMHDITERKRLEKELQQREAAFRALVDKAGDNIVRYDNECRILYFNAQLAATLGVSGEECIGKTPSEAFPGGIFDELENKLRQVIAHGNVLEHFITLPDIGKGERYHRLCLIAERDVQGRVCGALVIGQDITERTRMEAELAERERKFHNLAESSPDYIVCYDRDIRHGYFNAALLCHFGLGSAEEAIGKRPGEVWPDGRFDEIEQAAGQAIKSGVVTTVEVCEPSAAGEERFYQIRVVPERNADGQITGAVAFGRDITAIRVTERRLAQFIDSLPGLAYTFRLAPDGHASFPFVSSAIKEIYGLEPEDVKDDFMPIHILAHPEDRPCIDAAIAESARTMMPFRIEYRVCRMGQPERWLDVRSTPERAADGSIVWNGLMLDISERKRMEEVLAVREREFRTLVEHSPDTVVRYGRDLRRLYVNPAFAALVEGGAVALIGTMPSECPGGEHAATYEQNLGEVFASGKDREVQFKWTNKHGREVCSLIHLTPEFGKDGTVESILSVGRDITELHAFRQKVHQMAFYDSLTALPNRALFHDRLRQMLTDASWHDQLAGVMMIDMDRFKEINDTLGHTVGDQLLRETAARLSTCVRAYDTVARLGGDEFALLLPDIRVGADLGRIASKVLGLFDERFLLDGKEVFVSCSIGIALYPNDSTEADDLLKYADSAMYFAKRSGRANFRFYSKDLTATAQERLTLESELRYAIERNELELYYQPKVSLQDGMMIGSEALLRWRHQRLGMVPPNQFIPIAEDSGLIVDLGNWVLYEACRTASEWNADGKPLHKVAINLSARQFQSQDLAKTVSGILKETDCRPEWIELEITESLLLDEDGKTMETLSAFRSMGISIAIDDFGTGYSALSYLARFPIDTLKIDRSFIHSVTTENYRAELVKAILSIARCLGQQVVAEGVETVEQAAFLQANGCQVAQGFLYSKPLPKMETASLPRHFDCGNPAARADRHGGGGGLSAPLELTVNPL